MINGYSWHRVGTKGGSGPSGSRPRQAPCFKRSECHPSHLTVIHETSLIQMSFSSFHIIHIILQLIKSFDSHSFHSRVILMPFFHFLSFLYFDSHLHHLRLIYLILVSFLSFICGTRGVLLPRPPPFVPTLCQEYRLTIGLGGSGPTITSVSDRGGLWPYTGSDCTHPKDHFLSNFASSLDLHKESPSKCPK